MSNNKDKANEILDNKSINNISETCISDNGKDSLSNYSTLNITESENSTIISTTKKDTEIQINDDSIIKNEKISKTKKIKKELWVIIKLALPISISEYLSFFILMTSNIFVGHIGATELASVALGNTFCNATGWFIFIGLGTALDTLCSQAYTAAKTNKEKKTLGLIVQRSSMVVLILCIPIAILWFFSEKLFLLLGQDSDVAKMANIYTKIEIFGMIPFVLFDYLRRFLQTQGLVRPPLYIMAAMTPINVLLHYIFVTSDISPLSTEKRYLGAPISVVIVYWMLFATILFYVYHSKAKECWAKIDIKAACSGWKQFVKLGIPGMLMMLTEILVFETYSIAAGIIGKFELAAQAVIVSVSSCTFNLFIGISIAACVRIGNLLGSGNKELAKFSSKIIFAFSAFVGLCSFTFLFILRNFLVKIFSSDQEVNELAAKVMMIISVFEFIDAIVSPNNGILRGCGKQKIGAIMNITSHWVFGVPIGLVLGFSFGYKLYGMWSALVVSIFGLCIAQYVVIHRTNWEKECIKAKQRYDTQKIA